LATYQVVARTSRRLELVELLDMPADGIMAANPKKPRKRARDDGSGGGSGKAAP
jgi:hypothetical protein